MNEPEIPERLVPLVEFIRQDKEERVADPSHRFDTEETDVLTSVAFVRDGVRMAACFFPADRDRMLQAAELGVYLFGADEVITVFETFIAKPAFDAEFHRNPDPGEFQALFRACRTDLVGEAIMVMAYRADGDDAVGLRYTVDRPNRTVSWEQPRVLGKGEGRVSNGLASAFARASFDTRLAELADADPLVRAEMEEAKADLTPEEVTLHTDIVGLKVMAAAGFPTMYLTNDAAKAAVVEESLRRSRDLLAFDQNGNKVTEPKPWMAPSALDEFTARLRRDFEAERNQSWLDDERYGTANRAARRRAEVEARRKSRGGR